MSLAQTSVGLVLPQSPFPPLAAGFMGLGTGYLDYGTQETPGTIPAPAARLPAGPVPWVPPGAWC